MKSKVLPLIAFLMCVFVLKPSGHTGSVLNEYTSHKYPGFTLLLWGSLGHIPNLSEEVMS